MRIDIISAVPSLLQSPLSNSILQRAQNKKLVEICVHDLRDWGKGNYRQIDDKPYGGDAGMVLMVQPLDECISSLKTQRLYDQVIYLTPDGETFTQKIANQLSLFDNIILICGHYKGIDQRVRDMHVTREISIGDFVLTGGELPACILCDAIIRLLPGVLNNETSALTDSFQDNLLAPPIYTRPEVYKGHTVPSVLLSGNPSKIEAWQQEQALHHTQDRRPDLLDREGK